MSGGAEKIRYSQQHTMGKVGGILDMADSFECMWVEESKTEVVLAAEVVSPTLPPATTSISLNGSLHGKAYAQQDPLESSPSQGKGLGKLSDARADKRVKEDELQQQIRIVIGTPPTSKGGMVNSSSLVDMADDESKLTSDIDYGYERGIIKLSIPSNVDDTDDVFDGVEGKVQSNDESKIQSSNLAKVVSPEEYRLETTLSCSSYYEDDDAELTWRLHPAISLSDWNIEINTKNGGGKVITYPVHKSVMAVGPRRSNFFAHEFKKHSAAVRKANAEAERAANAARLAVEQKRKDEEKLRMERIFQQQRQRDAAANSNIISKLAAGCSLIGTPAPMEYDVRTPPNGHRRVSSPINGRSTVSMDDLDDETQAKVKAPKFPNVTKLDLDELAADAFPYALDYMYSSHGFLDIRTEHATALYYLSHKLDIKSLQVKCEQFWMKDLTIDTLTKYYKHARVFNETSIISTAELLFAKHLFDLSDDSVVTLLATVDAPFMCNVIRIVVANAMKKQTHLKGQGQLQKQQFEEDLKCFYFHLSVLIAVYCNIHRRSLSIDTFWQLTDERHLPIIDAKAAKSFSETQEYIAGPNFDLTSLTVRCLKVLSKHWDEELSSQFGNVSLVIDGDKNYNKETTSQRNRKRRELAAASRNGDASVPPIDIPSVCGDALEEFVSLALRNAKTQITQLEKVNTMLMDQNNELEQELQRLKALNSTKSKSQDVEEELITDPQHEIRAPPPTRASSPPLSPMSVGYETETFESRSTSSSGRVKEEGADAPILSPSSSEPMGSPLKLVGRGRIISKKISSKSVISNGDSKRMDAV